MGKVYFDEHFLMMNITWLHLTNL